MVLDQAMARLILLRHGESVWNKQNRFTGWTDVELSEEGIKEAEKAGKLLKKKGFTFDVAFTSMLKRATHTLDIVLDILNYYPPIFCSWRLNERFYGALQGLNKSQTAEKYGDAQVHRWRRSYSTRPPALTKDDKRYPGNDRKYSGLLKKDLPLTESLQDTYRRVLPYYRTEMVPLLKEGKTLLISAHGNSLRALVKYLDQISDSKIASLDIPTGIPLVYELDAKNLKPKRHYYLSDGRSLQQAINSVRNQGKAKK
jgi:2,3-bisphosphoglycerate-dependent phosphoglycerate mutase